MCIWIRWLSFFCKLHIWIHCHPSKLCDFTCIKSNKPLISFLMCYKNLLEHIICSFLINIFMLKFRYYAYSSCSHLFNCNYSIRLMQVPEASVCNGTEEWDRNDFPCSLCRSLPQSINLPLTHSNDSHLNVMNDIVENADWQILKQSFLLDILCTECYKVMHILPSVYAVRPNTTKRMI